MAWEHAGMVHETHLRVACPCSEYGGSRPARAHVGHSATDALVSPTAALLLLLVASSPAGYLVISVVAQHGLLSSTSTVVAAGRCWCLSIVNSTITVHMAQAPGQLARRARARRRGRNAGWAALRRNPAAQEHVACLVFGVGQLVLHVENGLIEIFYRYADRRRRLRAAGMSGAGRRAVLLLR